MVDLALMLDLMFKFINLISQIFDLSVEFPYILVYEMILLLLFQESWGNFFQVVDATFLFDLFESLSDCFHSLSVVFDNLHSFFVLGDQVSHSESHKWKSICALSLGLYLSSMFQKSLPSFTGS